MEADGSEANPAGYYAWNPSVPLGAGAAFHRPDWFGVLRLVTHAPAPAAADGGPICTDIGCDGAAAPLDKGPGCFAQSDSPTHAVQVPRRSATPAAADVGVVADYHLHLLHFASDHALYGRGDHCGASTWHGDSLELFMNPGLATGTR